MRNIRELLKKYKTPLLILGVLLLGALFLVIMELSGKVEDTPVAPVVIQEREKPTYEAKVQKTTPYDGSTEAKQGDKIKIHLEEPVKVETVEYRVTPEISLAFRTYDERNRIVTIFPDEEIWKENVPYTITITQLENAEGEDLGKPIEYTYIFKRPEKFEGGESWLNEEGAEENKDYQEDFLNSVRN
ncbi:hypothetical protein GF360_00670 [candidate division WWE3 bacterium]|nr:hypothetical protein [candidate division WWE3 bacterium]